MRAFEYESSYNALIGKAMNGMVKADPLIGDIRRGRSRHGGPSRNVGGENPLDHNQVCVSFNAPIDHQTLLNLDIEEHTTFVGQLGRSQTGSAMARLEWHDVTAHPGCSQGMAWVGNPHR